MENSNLPQNHFFDQDGSNEPNEKTLVGDQQASEKISKEEVSKNEYDQPASLKEISGLRQKIEEQVENKAKDLKISKEKLIELADLDLESLEAENLKDLDLNQGGLEFIRDSIEKAINEFWRSEKTGKLVAGTTSKLEGSINEAFEFAKKHKKIVSLGELALYASSFGPAVLKDLAGDDVEVEIYGEKVSLKDLADNPELIETIDRAHNYASPIDILSAYSPPESFSHNDVEFSFKSHDKVIDENNVERLIYFDSIMGNSENLKKMEADLENIGISFKYEEKCKLDDFFKNKDRIIDIFSKDLEIPREKMEKYIESLIMPDVSNISVVEFEDFKINKNLEIPEDVTKLQQVKKEVYEKNNVYSENGSFVPENWLKAEKELEKWGKENGYENFDKELYKEIKENNENPMNKLEILKFQEDFEHENSENFKKNVIDVFEKEGYDISTLKEIAENNPEEVIKIISEVMGKNVKYDYIEANLDLISKDLRDIYAEIKHNQGIPYITFESGRGVCHDYGITFVAVKNALEEEGVPNLKKFVSISTISGKQNHLWVAFATVDPDNPDRIIMTYGDPTWDDSSEGEFNAVDEDHYYTSIKEKIDEVHQKALKKINDYNIFAFQEKLKEVLTQYDPRQYDRSHKIEGNKKLREHDKNIEALREERMKNVKGSLKNAREKIKKMYKKKDSETSS
ncbi:hypothetical protein KAK05_00990, partial [Candidatus Parcubacteria bacterium]|nr:hypothetical protein [Candidatus Parcubacteria bacterium]